MGIKQGKIAPLILTKGDKWNYKGAKSKDNPEGYMFGQIPRPIRKYINQTLTGNNGNILKLITLFMEQQEGSFRASKNWVLEETGMAEDKYYKARLELEKMKWIICEDDNIYINYNFIWEEALKEKKDRIDVLSLRK